MRMHLHPWYPNGHFGDPALYLQDIAAPRAYLLDCGDLSHFTPRQLLKVQRIFISHCHIDHFFGFDQFLRIHMGSEKQIFLYGPPETTLRVGGKLQGYTWNLIRDQNIEFIVTDLNVHHATRTIVRFHARNGFSPGVTQVEPWNPHEPVIAENSYQVRCIELDHRTPSLAYSIEEKLALSVNVRRIDEMNLLKGPWIGKLKHLFLFGNLEREILRIERKDGSFLDMPAAALASDILLPRQRQKLAYATDGAASPENRAKLLSLARDAGWFFAETCFLDADRTLAEATKHFTARFIAELAHDAHVKTLVPTHFSKRYLNRPEAVLDEIRKYFEGEVIG